MSTPLNFGSSGNPFDKPGFDNAPGPDGFDLSGFDKADGTTTVPAGWYVCRIERGDLKWTKSKKPAYRLCFKTVEPAAHAGFTLWKWYVMADANGENQAKIALAPLGLTTAANLRAVFPPTGRAVHVKALVTVKADPQRGPSNDVERFELCPPPADTVAAPNPFSVPLDDKEGGKPE
ncbi:hypothetical protein [Fimbriiglobus ruber]|uniref:Uncharacterized protein n=1 Tax=Fimbriiglobus ruber TaxID=1908690 RepID=A0A225DDX5_9BACT|nr:hypothetical protein [Fimbriiglobus ruber]OWK35546.1 hypothetical protein FRUB_08109 [Fimbriiglobus ruber]